MNLQRPNSGESTHTANRSRDVVPCSGICTICIDGCEGNCEVFKASFRGRELIHSKLGVKIVYPMHPRTRRSCREHGIEPPEGTRVV